MVAIKNCKITGWQNFNELIHSLLILEFFKKNFSRSIWYIGLKYSNITDIVMLFHYSEISFIIWILMKYQDFSCYYKITSSAHAVKILFLSFTSEDIVVATVTYIIFLFFIGILTSRNRKYKYYCLYFSFITSYPSFITFL